MRAVLLAALLILPSCFAESQLTGFPFTDESLTYSVNWPSGLGLGEVHVRARRDGPGWIFDLSVDAGIPGLQVKDTYTSHANGDFCSTEFTRDFSHGAKKSSEKETIERSQETVTRKTIPNGGGQSQFSIPDCVKDGLTMLFYARRELGQGRVPAPQQILFGGLYDMTLTYAGEQTIQVGGKPAISDKVLCSVKGPSSSEEFEMYFARDPARTPLLVKVPFPVGSFSMELVR
jgi:hypothetical protein